MSTLTDNREDTTAARGGRRWLVPLLVLGAVVAAVITALVLLLGGDDPAEPTLSDPPDPDEGVGAADPASIDLLERLEAGSELTFHATYTSQAGDGEVSGELRLDLYRDAGWVRQDSMVSAGEDQVRTAAIQSPEGEVTSCVEQAGRWTCASAEQQADDVFGALAAQLTGADLETTTEPVGDLEATCYAVIDDTGRSQLCISAEGIPVRITATDGSVLELQSLEREVDRSVFDPPADPTPTDA